LESLTEHIENRRAVGEKVSSLQTRERGMARGLSLLEKAGLM